MNSSLCWIVSGLMFLIASAGAVDGTAEPIWVAVSYTHLTLPTIYSV